MMNPSVKDDYIERLHTCAAEGDMVTLNSIIKVVQFVDATNDKGWTALMFASRNGHAAAVKALLEHGADPSAINSTGQNSLQIAKFWNHREVIELFSPDSSDSFSLHNRQKDEVVNYFSRNPLDRAAHRRKDKEWLKNAMCNPSSKYVMYHNLQPVVTAVPAHSIKNPLQAYKLCTATYDQVEAHLDTTPVVVFLGIDSKITDVIDACSKENKVAWFAIDISEIEEDKLSKFSGNAQAELLPNLPGMMLLEKETEAGIMGQGRSLLAWHDRYQFCPTCGSKTVPAEAGYKRECSNKDCRSLQGIHNTSYPRIDPTVIMAVISPDGKQLLLGRGARFPRGMFSCLAGFIEPGESLEDACRREVEEECGIKIGQVDYHSCQPWPMPSSLMLGILAHAVSTEIKVDKNELEEAQWFTRQDVVLMLTRKHPNGWFCPPQQAIAHQLIKAWVNMSSQL